MVGIFQHDLPASEAASIYTILTIGDGLVAQIPALLTSTATAIIITRSNTDEERFATRAVNQLLKDTKSLILVGIGLILFGLVPGFPTGILMTMGLMMSALGYTIIMIDKGEDNIVTRFFKPQVPKRLKNLKI